MSCAAAKETAPTVHSSAKPDATVNPCTLCAPLGAALATAGVRGAIPLLHGAQGCATYIRRYLISHFREPMDVASSSFGEAQTVFGGEDNLGRALDNVLAQYHPELVTVATTCLAETIGDDVPLLLTRYRTRTGSALPLVHAATPSYKDGHVEGFHAMVYALVKGVGLQPGRAFTGGEPAAAARVAGGSAPFAGDRLGIRCGRAPYCPTTRIVWTA